jgi:hypothetical protein
MSHTIIAVDISAIGVPTEIYPVEGQMQMVPTICFRGWDNVERYMLGIGADVKEITIVAERLKKTGVGVLTII